MGAPGVTAGGDGLLERGCGPRMWWMDCWGKFGPLQLDSYCVNPCEGKTVDLGGVFCPFGGLMGAPGVTAGGDGPLGRG